MRSDARRGHAGGAWVAVAGVMCMAAWALRQGDAAWLDALSWQGAAGLSTAWRAFTAAWVHWSDAHLHANVLGAAAVASLGWLARVRWVAVMAWLLAWPLTQLELLAVATPAHHGGLSGWLHAGVAVVAVTLLWPAEHHDARARRWGLLLATGLVAALIVELWSGRRWVDASAGVWLTQHAHVMGALAGAAATVFTHTIGRRASKNASPLA